MYPPQAPWTGVGALQQDLSRLESRMSEKANAYELRETRGYVDRLESQVRELSAEIDGLRTRLQSLEQAAVTRSAEA